MSIFDNQQWTDAVNDLKEKAANFTALFSRVQSSTPQTPALADEKLRLLNRARVVKQTVEQVTRSVDKSYKSAQDALGSETDATLQGLGVLPLIPIAIITGAAAGITYVVTDFKKYLDENDRIRQLQSEGYTTEQAIEIVNKPRGIAGGIERALKSYGPWIAAGVVVWLMTQRKFKL